MQSITHTHTHTHTHDTHSPTVAVTSRPLGPLHRISGLGEMASVMSSMMQVRIIPESTRFTCRPDGLIDTVCASATRNGEKSVRTALKYSHIAHKNTLCGSAIGVDNASFGRVCLCVRRPLKRTMRLCSSQKSVGWILWGNMKMYCVGLGKVGLFPKSRDIVNLNIC